jgi:hypothetical protein
LGYQTLILYQEHDMRVVKMLVLCGVAALVGCFAVVGSAWATRGPLWGVSRFRWLGKCSL